MKSLGFMRCIAFGLCAISFAATATVVATNELVRARDRQDMATLDKLAKQLSQTASQSPKSDASYRAALAYSYSAEVAMELHDKKKAVELAEAGLDQAKKAVDANANNAEYHRLLGELCGQVIPANPLLGAMKYGTCARDEINKAIELDGKLALAYVSRGVGNYYLPATMGGGVDVALKDLDKAIALDPNLSEAYLWKGVILKKANRDAEARQAFTQALKLDPNRLWAKEQLSKTPAH